MELDLIIDTTEKYNNIAVLENKRLTLLNREKLNSKFSVGDFFLGTVKKVMPGLNAAFVNVGYHKDAFLHYSDLGLLYKFSEKYLRELGVNNQTADINIPKNEEEIPKDGKITDLVKTGQKLLVQINKEPIASKGPRLGCEYSLAGRFLILVPFSNNISISQKIKDKKEKARLAKLITSIKPKGHGVICRTVAKGQKVAELHADMSYLVERWEQVKSNLISLTSPSKVLGEVNRAASLLRDLFNSNFNHVYVNDEKLYKGIQDYIVRIAPDKKDIIKLYNKSTPILDYFNVTKQVKLLFGKKVMLANGGYLIIEHTEAMHVIDVNSGSLGKKVSEKTQEENTLEVNLAAAEEIALQLRLRDMGGIIVVDFIDMYSNEDNEKLYQFLKEKMNQDRAKHNILPPTRIGLVQITRQRVRPELKINTSEVCPCCDGKKEVPSTLMLIDEIKNAVLDFSQQNASSKVILKTHPYVAAYINKSTGWFKTTKIEWQKASGSKIEIIPSPSLSFLSYKVSKK